MTEIMPALFSVGAPLIRGVADKTKRSSSLSKLRTIRDPTGRAVPSVAFR